MRRLAGLLWLALLFVAVAAPTFPRDDTGAVSAACSWVDVTGASYLCDPTHPVPITTTPPGTPAVDPTGWGRTWQLTRSTTGVFNAAANIDLGGFFLDQFTAIVWEVTGGNAVPYRSVDAGRTWASTGPTKALPAGPVALRSAVLAPNGNYILGLNAGSTLATSTDRVSWIAPTFTGVAFAGTTNADALAAQGGTVLAAVNDSVGAATKICRSIDNGVSFNCATPAAIPTTFTALFQALATPSASVWLITGQDGANTRTFRSTDDGVTWTQVDLFVTVGVPGRTAAGCPTSSICLVTDGSLIRRSTDGGVTWATVLATGITGARISGFVLFGQSVVVAQADGAGTQNIWRSIDNGASWTPMVNTATAPCAGVATSQVLVQSVTGGGRAMAVFTKAAGGTNVPCIIYSQSVPAGGVLNGNGQQLSAQGDPATAAGRWPVQQTDGVNLQAVKAGATAAVAADPAAVINQSPNYPTASTGGLPAMPVQGAVILNAAPVVSAANTAATVTLTGAAGARVCLRTLAIKATGAAATFTLTVSDGATIVLDFGTQTAALNGAAVLFTATTLLCGSTGNNVVVNIGAGGVGAVTTTSAIADRQ